MSKRAVCHLPPDCSALNIATTLNEAYGPLPDLKTKREVRLGMEITVLRAENAKLRGFLANVVQKELCTVCPNGLMYDLGLAGPDWLRDARAAPEVSK